jgi:hypothetical protein
VVAVTCDDADGSGECMIDFEGMRWRGKRESVEGALARGDRDLRHYWFGADASRLDQ